MNKMILSLFALLMLFSGCQNQTKQLIEIIDSRNRNDIDLIMQNIGANSLAEVLQWDGVIFKEGDCLHYERTTGKVTAKGSPDFRTQTKIWVHEINKSRAKLLLKDLHRQNNCFRPSR